MLLSHKHHHHHYSETDSLLPLEFYILGNLVAFIYLGFIDPEGIIPVILISVIVGYVFECLRTYSLKKLFSIKCQPELFNLLPTIAGAFMIAALTIYMTKLGM